MKGDKVKGRKNFQLTEKQTNKPKKNPQKNQTKKTPKKPKLIHLLVLKPLSGLVEEHDFKSWIYFFI